MSLDGSFGPDEGGDYQARISRLSAQADVARAARLAGYKSPFRRILDRLRPHRQQPASDPESNHGTTDDPPS